MIEFYIYIQKYIRNACIFLSLFTKKKIFSPRRSTDEIANLLS